MERLGKVRTGPGPGGREKEKASKMLTTGLQHACNMPATVGAV